MRFFYLRAPLAMRCFAEPGAITVAKGNNTYQIVHKDSSIVAVDEATALSN